MWDAIAEQAGHPLQLTADATTPAVTAEAPWRFPWPVLGLPILYVGSYPLLKGRLQNNVEARRFWFGGLATISIVALFLLVTLTPDAVIKSFAQALPFPLFVSVVALADGFNPCAFTVLIILLSLLTHTRRRRDMAIVGGTFVATSAVMYFLFIMVMIGLGAVLLGAVWHSVFVDFGKRNCDRGPDQPERLLLVQEGSFPYPFPSRSSAPLPSGAGRIVRKLGEAGNDRLKFFAAIGSTILLAVFVNVVELGCTAILPCGLHDYPGQLLQYSAHRRLALL